MVMKKYLLLWLGLCLVGCGQPEEIIDVPQLEVPEVVSEPEILLDQAVVIDAEDSAVLPIDQAPELSLEPTLTPELPMPDMPVEDSKFKGYVPPERLKVDPEAMAQTLREKMGLEQGVAGLQRMECLRGGGRIRLFGPGCDDTCSQFRGQADCSEGYKYSCSCAEPGECWAGEEGCVQATNQKVDVDVAVYDFEEIFNQWDERNQAPFKEACDSANGEWFITTNVCADTCEGLLASGKTCAGRHPYNYHTCNCGVGLCWDGDKCVEHQSSVAAELLEGYSSEQVFRCEQAGGSWETFSSDDLDNCRMKNSPQTGTYEGCDCGPEKCWENKSVRGRAVGCVADRKAEDKQACSSSGGNWTNFSNGCADFCSSSGKLRACTMAFVESCGCGVDKCWDGETCVYNPQ